MRTMPVPADGEATAEPSAPMAVPGTGAVTRRDVPEAERLAPRVDEVDVLTPDHPLADGAAARLWTETAEFVQARIRDGSADLPLVGAALAQLLAAVQLQAFPPPRPGAGRRPDGATVTAAVRRAKAFMEANAGRPICVADVARAARLSVRGLQAAFLRETGSPPMEHLRRIRLDGARRELLAADPTGGDTVAGVARRWGFAHQSRFAAVYREAFGETPRDTLRR